MGRIARLSEHLANQIAAGEVVERPASVVKELVENALDAGARRIVVHLELGGKQLIRVEDDGHGMDADDARLAIERHATSKLRTADDLAAITTLGFRGEALPSIASVSHFTLRTRTADALAGTEISVHGGVVISAQDAASSVGTVVDVADLFYNLPARRKFLKADAAEAAQVSKMVTQLALANPQVGFSCTSGPRTLLQCPPVASLRERLYQIYRDRADLVPVDKAAGGLHVTGFVARLAEHGALRGPQHVYVNRRLVRDRTIAHAMLDAYSSASIKERSPEVHLFIEMPPEQVDVNVHPTKAEVRFREPSLVHEVVRRAVMEALGRTGVPELTLTPAPPAPGWGGKPTPLPGLVSSAVAPNRWATTSVPRVAEDAGAPRVEDLRQAAGDRLAAAALAAMVGTVGAAASSDPTPTASTAAGPLGLTSAGGPMTPLGQFRDTFILAVDADGIVIIDQHVAHERVLFERVMQRLTAGDLPSQRLLVPLVHEVGRSGVAALADRGDDLRRLGYDIEPFGDEAVHVRAVPALLRTDEAAAALDALADDLEALDRGGKVHDALGRIAALTACHAAVRANDPLTLAQMQHILEELQETAYSTICPHGRPVMLRLTRREIESRFERI